MVKPLPLRLRGEFLVNGRRARFYLRVASALMLSIGLFFPYFLGQIGSLRLLIVMIGFAALALEVFLMQLALRRRILVVVGSGVYLAIAVGVIEVIALRLDDRVFAINAEHLFAMLPLFAALGWLLYQSEQGHIYLVVLLSVASLVGIVAVGESLLDRSLLGREYDFAISQREGIPRAIVGSENVLVLGAILAALVPLSLKLEGLRYQVGVGIVLVAGAWATGSRAPALICTVVAVVQYFPILQVMLQRYLWIVKAGAGAVLVGLACFSIFVWTPYIPGADDLAYSSNYRGAIYSLVPEFLIDRPFGYVFSAAPLDLWVIESEARGSVDIARSVDSEIVYAIFGLGWLGLGFFVAALFVSIAAIKHDVALGLSALTLTCLGFVLALHAWDAMGPLWYLLLGACFSISVWPWARNLTARIRPKAIRPRRVGHSDQTRLVTAVAK